MVIAMTSRGPNLFLPLDRTKLKNWNNLDPDIMAALAKYDPGNAHAIPWMWGTTGIGYNKAKTGGPIDSWDAMWDPKYKGQISMLDDGREVFAAALFRMGKSVNETDPKVLEQAGYPVLQ